MVMSEVKDEHKFNSCFLDTIECTACPKMCGQSVLVSFGTLQENEDTITAVCVISCNKTFLVRHTESSAGTQH